MDDIIDLELEKIERIMSKIDADPKSEDVKTPGNAFVAEDLKRKAPKRRTGVITAEGDIVRRLPWDCVMALKEPEWIGASTQDGGTQRLSLLQKSASNAAHSRVRYRTRKRTTCSSTACVKLTRKCTRR